MNLFTYQCYSKTQNIQNVVEQLTNLDEELRDTSLQNLIAFNHTYLIITRNVYQRFGNNYFVDDQLMSAIDNNFGNLYFTALHNYVLQKKCPPAWETLFRACEHKHLHQFVYMALGVNAHVNNDLSQTLHSVMKGNYSAKDYILINEVIKHSLHEVVISLHEKKIFLEFSKNIFEPVYAQFLNILIQRWRKHAWEQYVQLQNKQITVEEIEIYAEKIASLLTKSNNLFYLPRVFFT